MEMDVLTLWILISILILSITFVAAIVLIGRKIIQYYNQRAILDYKAYIIGMGLKKYVDDTLNEYIMDSIEENITTNPKYIEKTTLNSKDELELLTKVVNQVIIFMPESFKEQMRKVYDIDRVIDDAGNIGLNDIVTRRAYSKIMALAISANSVKENGQVPLQELINE